MYVCMYVCMYVRLTNASKRKGLAKKVEVSNVQNLLALITQKELIQKK